MWELLLKLQKTMQAARPLTVQYSNTVGFHHNLKLGRTDAFCNLGSLFIWLTCLLSLRSLLVPDPARPKGLPQETVLSGVIHMFYIACYSIQLSSIWTLKYEAKTTVWMLSQAQRYSKRREEDPPRLFLFKIGLLAIVLTVIIGVPTTSLLPLTGFYTPNEFLLDLMLPQRVQSWLGAAAIHVLNIIGWALFETVAYISTIQAMAYLNAALCELQYILRPSMMEPRRRLFGEILNRFNHQRRIYFQSLIFFWKHSNFGRVFVPVLIATGFFINVTLTLVCVKYYAGLHPVVLQSCVGMDLAIVFLSVYFHYVAMTAVENSDKFHKFWGRRLMLKRERKELWACLPLRIPVGSFLNLKRTTLLVTFDKIVNMVITILLI